MGRNKEINNLVAKQQKDRKSYVVCPVVSGKPSDDFLFSAKISELVNIAETADLSDKELLCFVSTYVLRWGKWKLHTVLNGMGKSHTAIARSLRSAEKKIEEHLGGRIPVGKKVPLMIEKDVSVSDEIGEIFSDLSEKPSCWE